MRTRKNGKAKTAAKAEPKLRLEVHGTQVAQVAQLKPHPRNYRKHLPDQLDHIVASLKTHGIYRPIVVASDYTILAGHGLVEACKMLGLAEVPITKLPIAPDDPRALKLLAGDNEISKGASSDDRLLAEILKSLASEQDGLLGTGFDAMQLAALAFTTQAEVSSFDAAAEWAGMPEFDAGSKSFDLLLHFSDEAERDAIVKKLKLQEMQSKWKTGSSLWSTWYPPRSEEDLQSAAWQEK